MDRPDDDIAHEEFCNSINEVQKAKRGLAGIKSNKLTSPFRDDQGRSMNIDWRT